MKYLKSIKLFESEALYKEITTLGEYSKFIQRNPMISCTQGDINEIKNMLSDRQVPDIKLVEADTIKSKELIIQFNSTVHIVKHVDEYWMIEDTTKRVLYQPQDNWLADGSDGLLEWFDDYYKRTDLNKILV